MTERKGGIKMEAEVCTDDGFWYNCVQEPWFSLMHEVKCNRGIDGCHCKEKGPGFGSGWCKNKNITIPEILFSV